MQYTTVQIFEWNENWIQSWRILMYDTEAKNAVSLNMYLII